MWTAPSCLASSSSCATAGAAPTSRSVASVSSLESRCLEGSTIMQIERLARITAYGSHWILWVLVVASVIALAIVLERAVLLWSSRDNLTRLRREIRALLAARDVPGARRRLD